MLVSNLLGRGRVNCFSGLLRRCERIDPSNKTFVDGGAGLGETAERILGATPANEGPVIAFEPNPNNTRQFKVQHPRLNLVKQAMSNQNGTAEFMVTSKTVVDGANPYLEAGTSFVGKLSELSQDLATRPVNAEYYPVSVTRLDTALRGLGVTSADFVKLDLQGAEMLALEGLGSMVSSVKWMWLEFSNQPGLLNYLVQNDFMIFDTEYLFVGPKTELIEELFEVSRGGRNSIGKEVFFGRRRHVWRDFERAFNFARTKRRMVQTDMVAVAPHYLPVFLEAAIDLIEGDQEQIRWQVPRALF